MCTWKNRKANYAVGYSNGNLSQIPLQVSRQHLTMVNVGGLDIYIYKQSFVSVYRKQEPPLIHHSAVYHLRDLNSTHRSKQVYTAFLLQS